MARHEFDACVRVMEVACSRNGTELPAFFTAGKLAAAHRDGETSERASGLFRWVILRTMVPLAGVFFANGFIVPLNLWTPMASTTIFPAQQDKVFFVQLDIALAQLLTALACAVSAEMLPRLLQMRLTIALQCAALALLGVASKYQNYAAFLTCVALVTAATEGVWAMVIMYPSEAFPTQVRATASAIANVMVRLAPIAAPYAIVALEEHSFALACGVFSAISAAQLGLAMTLTVETTSRALIEESALVDARVADKQDPDAEQGG
jgi:hypothetical protein